MALGLLLSDREVAQLLVSGTANRPGTGGRSSLIDVDGLPVFVGGYGSPAPNGVTDRQVMA